LTGGPSDLECLVDAVAPRPVLCDVDAIGVGPSK
jgi:hypothetical protein